MIAGPSGSLQPKPSDSGSFSSSSGWMRKIRPTTVTRKTLCAADETWASCQAKTRWVPDALRVREELQQVWSHERIRPVPSNISPSRHERAWQGCSCGRSPHVDVHDQEEQADDHGEEALQHGARGHETKDARQHQLAQQVHGLGVVCLGPVLARDEGEVTAEVALAAARTRSPWPRLGS